MRALIATLIALMLFATTPVAAEDFEDGVVAYNAGDYQKALRLWKPLAEQGNKFVQSILGKMHLNGWGVPQDYAKAVHWWTKAAKQGYAEAQFLVGRGYAKGKGVPENRARVCVV